MNSKLKSYRWMLNSKAAIAFGVTESLVYTIGIIYLDDQWVLSLFEENKVLYAILIGCLIFLSFLSQSIIGSWINKLLKLEQFVQKSISIFLSGSMFSVYSAIYFGGFCSLLILIPDKIDISIYNELFFSIEHLIIITISHYLFTISYTLLFRDPMTEILEVYTESTTYLKPIIEKPSDKKEASIISIQTETVGDSFKLDLKSFVYARAEGNYTDVFIQNESTDIKKETKRILISKLDQQIEESGSGTSIFRTHKSYIVNLNMIDSFKGNSNGFKIFLRLNFLQEIPVSRANVSSFKNKLENLDLV